MKNQLFSLLFLFSPLLSLAHGYWLEVKGNGQVGQAVTVRIFFGEYENNLREKGKMLASMSDFKAYALDPSGQQIEIPLRQTETCWEGSFTPAQSGTYQVLALNDTRGVQDWTRHGLGVVRPIEYLRQHYVAGKPSVATGQPLPVDVTAEWGETVRLTARKAGAPLPKTSLTVLNPAGWEKKVTTDEQGVATFKPAGKGIYLVELDERDKTPGTFGGKEYQGVRTKFALTVHAN